MNPFILAAEYVTDTVALVVYLENRRLGADSQAVFDSAENSNTIIHIPAIVFAEILYLSEFTGNEKSFANKLKLS